MKKTKILYWVFTGLFAAAMLFSSVPNIMVDKGSIDLISGHLHYPQYLIGALGVAKLLAVIVILIPNFPRLKEWAYAGLTFDLAGAVFSMAAVGDPFSDWWPMSIFFIFLVCSYTYYHKLQKAKAVASLSVL